MAHVHIGQLTATKEWAKHLRPYGKRDFWKRERKEARLGAGDQPGEYGLQQSVTDTNRPLP